MIKIYKWMWQNFTNEFDKAIQISVTRISKKMHSLGLYKWMQQNCTNGCDKTIQMEVTKLYKRI